MWVVFLLERHNSGSINSGRPSLGHTMESDPSHGSRELTSGRMALMLTCPHSGPCSNWNKLQSHFRDCRRIALQVKGGYSGHCLHVSLLKVTEWIRRCTHSDHGLVTEGNGCMDGWMDVYDVRGWLKLNGFLLFSRFHVGVEQKVWAWFGLDSLDFHESITLLWESRESLIILLAGNILKDSACII